MLRIHPVSDLRNKFPQIEALVQGGEPVFLTKNGHGSMVVLSLEDYAQLTESVESKLDEADRAAAATTERSTHREVFSRARRRLQPEELADDA
ncbi:MAG: type II toxin-antitoxin system Phd/YefM family antitoxin [Bifidobacteriaceae bacterium]|jgi:prevent-host-death family protein|nr:type II toxin-antitoxin system Phd/YefM family antitoxin [Bifidobacteriaceae bacterium]